MKPSARRLPGDETIYVSVSGFSQKPMAEVMFDPGRI
jgi:hypothetical protein